LIFGSKYVEIAELVELIRE